MLGGIGGMNKKLTEKIDRKQDSNSFRLDLKSGEIDKDNRISNT